MHIVLDLDETLVFVSLDSNSNNDFKFKLQDATYYGKKRPGLDLFLSFVFKRFDSVSVWTAATEDYARCIIKNIMTPDQLKKLLFFKTRKDLQTMNNGNYCKPLARLFNDPKAKKLKLTVRNTIMIDDRADVLCNNIGNGILIAPWKGIQSDKYLLKLIIILDGIFHHNIGFGHFTEIMKLCHLVE